MSDSLKLLQTNKQNTWIDYAMNKTSFIHHAFLYNLVNYGVIIQDPRMWCLQWIENRGTTTALHQLTHWGRATHICVTKLSINSSDNGLSPRRHQAIIRTNAGILLIGTLGTNFSEILSKIHTFSLKKIHLKTSSAKWQPFCLGLNELSHWYHAKNRPTVKIFGFTGLRGLWMGLNTPQAISSQSKSFE